jgi:hypothetical protein
MKERLDPVTLPRFEEVAAAALARSGATQSDVDLVRGD